MKTGSCLCGGVAYELTEPLPDIAVCHCTQCRRTSGHCWSSTNVPNDQFQLTQDDTLAWYQSSPSARRGFCTTCGSSLFWQKDGEGTTAVAAGTIDGSTGLTLARHIFTEDKGDYYEIP